MFAQNGERGLGRVIRVVSNGVGRGGHVTVHVADYSEGIPPPVPDSVIVVGYNQVQMHYVGLGVMRQSADRFTLPSGQVVVAFNAGGCSSSTSGTKIWLCNDIYYALYHGHCNTKISTV